MERSLENMERRMERRMECMECRVECMERSMEDTEHISGHIVWSARSAGWSAWRTVRRTWSAGWSAWRTVRRTWRARSRCPKIRCVMENMENNVLHIWSTWSTHKAKRDMLWRTWRTWRTDVMECTPGSSEALQYHLTATFGLLRTAPKCEPSEKLRQDRDARDWALTALHAPMVGHRDSPPLRPWALRSGQEQR